jgi:hypothetical protein
MPTRTAPIRSIAQVPPGPRALAPELLRILFCTLVVVAHCDLALIELGIAGVAGFLGLSLGFGTDRADRPRLAARSRRAILVWLLWWAPYLALLLARDAAAGRPIGSGWRWWMLATGPSIHLWFLPALAATLLVLSRLAPVPGAALAMLALAAGATNKALDAPTWAPPLPQFLVTVVAASGALLGARAARWARLGRAIPLVLAGVVISAIADPWRGGLFLIAFGAAAACRAPGPTCGPAVRALSGLTGGVYLVHAAAILAWTRVARTESPAVVAPLVLASSAIVVALGRRTRLRLLFP